MDDEPEMDNGLPVVLRRRHRWVSRQTEWQIEKAWGPSGPQQTCQVCYEELPSHQGLRLHVNAHFLLHFCLCRFHDVYPYPVVAHRMGCFAGEGHVVDADNYTQYLEAIKPMIKKAFDLGCIILRVLYTTNSRPPEVSNGKEHCCNHTPARQHSLRSDRPPRRGDSSPCRTQPTGNSRGKTPMTTRGFYTIGPGLTQHYNGP